MLQARERETLVIVPSESKGAVAFWVARSDRAVARDMAAAINAAINAALAAADAARSSER